MTYRELMDALSKLSFEQLTSDVTVEDIDGECYPAKFVFADEEHGSLDEDHPIILVRAVPQSYVEYDSNNSGGSWWVSLDQWKALEKAGWEVDWRKEEWLGTMATRATKRGVTLRDAVKDWERITGLDSCDAGCPCCGQPHNFYEYDAKDKMIDSGPHASFTCGF